MRNYVLADLKRIIKRLPRIIVMAIIYAALLAVIYAAYKNLWTSITFVLYVEQYIAVLTTGLGLVELITVYADDFKAKTMQVAIGIGIPRRVVVLCKVIEAAVLTLIDLLLFALVAFAAGAVLHAGLETDQITEILISLLKVWLSVVSYVNLAMILMFFTQSTGPGTLLYLALSMGILNMLVSLLAGIEEIEFLHLDNYMLTTFIKTFTTRLMIGNFSAGALIGILVYIAIGYFLTVFLFRKRELEF